MAAPGRLAQEGYHLLLEGKGSGSSRQSRDGAKITGSKHPNENLFPEPNDALCSDPAAGDDPALLCPIRRCTAEISTPYPTIRCLAVEWLIRGDDNLNGTVEVSYRVMGDEPWSQPCPWCDSAGSTRNRTTPTYTWSNKFSGSIFNLKPGTGYEIRLTLQDPDGGRATEIVKANTRPVPEEPPDSRIIEVNPNA